MNHMEEVQQRYRTFAEVECKGYSDHYDRLSHDIASDDWLCDFISQMPETQPNLFLATLQFLSSPGEMPRRGLKHESSCKNIKRTSRESCTRDELKQMNRGVARRCWPPCPRGHSRSSSLARRLVYVCCSISIAITTTKKLLARFHPPFSFVARLMEMRHSPTMFPKSCGERAWTFRRLTSTAMTMRVGCWPVCGPSMLNDELVCRQPSSLLGR